MSDLISRENAIDAICKVWCYTTYDMCPHDDGYCKGCDEIEAIDALPSADAVSREDTVTLNSPISIQAEMVPVVRCKDCKHRPHLENENGSDYGFNVIGDETCPCVNNDDGWYSWMPKDNFYCGFGERKGGDEE